MLHRENEEHIEQANMLGLGSTAIQPKMKPTTLKPTNFPAKTLLLKPHLKPSFFSFNPKTPSSSSSSLTTFHWLPGSLRTCGQATAIRKAAKLSDSAADPLPCSDEEEEEEEEGSLYKEKLGVVVKPMVKPRIVLKFVWMQKILGIALNQVIPGHGTIPLSPYYFWPKQDAWDQLKILLEKKPWISQKQMYMLLNQATDVIMLWQETSRNL